MAAEESCGIWTARVVDVLYVLYVDYDADWLKKQVAVKLFASYM